MRIRTVLFVTALWTASAAAGSVSFSKDIQPILQNSCWKCHGASVQLSKLDLRTREAALKGGDKGPAVIPGKAEESRLYRLVSGIEKPAMPMDGKLTAEQVAAIKDWIDQGAVWDATAAAAAGAPVSGPSEDMPITPAMRKYWAFQQPAHHPVPPGHRHPIDAFIGAALQQKGLKPAPRADKTTLARRAYLDLIGLPPTPAQVAEFVNDQSPDAWGKLIDHLLASPQYGERWGRHWLDVARYADSNGFEHDFDRPNAWRYRDYVIRSFNKDTPYNVFLQEQLAGDELDWVTTDSLIATGFLRSYAKVGFREKDNPEFRYEYLDDMIATIGRGILGLTVQCARCHNHKFDPIAQKDYYKLQASLFGYVEVDLPLLPPAQARAYVEKTAELDARIRTLQQQIKTMEEPYRAQLLPPKIKRFPENVQLAVRTPEAQRTPGQVLLANQIIRTVNVSPAEIEAVMSPADLEKKKQLQAQVKEIEKERPKPLPATMSVTDGDYRFTPDGPGDEPAPGKGIKQEAVEGSFLHTGAGRYQVPPSYFLIRGDVNSRGSLMKPGFVSVITEGNPPVEIPPADGHTSGRRRALAEWLTSPENPLTARVAVNRIWHHHFGRGIVATLDNFGKMGEKPTHPELLDWLALEFERRGWSYKQMHRLIMTSDAYQRASRFNDEDDLAKDPDNSYLWRFRLQRLDAEEVRDAILAVSGTLNPEMYGKPVFPKLQDEILASMDKGIWLREPDGPKVWRRSVYVYRKRGLPFPMFEAFDLPDQNLSCGRRNVSTVPTQALMLMNDDWVLRQAKYFADRVAEAAKNDPGREVDLAYELALSRKPETEERAAALDVVTKHKLVDLTHVLLNLNEFLYER